MMARPAFIPAADWDALLVNGARTAAGEEIDPLPVIKIFTLDGGATWLLTEADPDAPDSAFGLCDLSLGCPELGYVSLSELASVRGRLGLRVEHDIAFVAVAPLSRYAAVARAAGRIVEPAAHLTETRS